MNNRTDEILAELQRIEEQHEVRILYACESGSRAWGFASPDSDFDVRFIYTPAPDWYLSVDLEHRRDVIEVPIDDLLDVSGWNLRKALGLLRKSNPPLMEWIQSPIVYLDRYETVTGLVALLNQYFSSTSCGYHYLSMAKKNYRGYLKGDEVRLKKYFYVLRPLLAARWIKEGHGVVPTEFSKLLDRLLPDGEIRATVDELLDLKSRSLESEYAPAKKNLNKYLDREIFRLEQAGFENTQREVDMDNMNRFFREQLERVWGRT